LIGDDNYEAVHFLDVAKGSAVEVESLLCVAPTPAAFTPTSFRNSTKWPKR